MEFLHELASLSPSLAALVVVAVFGYLMISKLLIMFEKHTMALDTFGKNMYANTDAINVNTQVTKAALKATREMQEAVLDLHKIHKKIYNS